MALPDNNPFSYIFGTAPGAGVPTYEQLQLRRKIAASLLGQKSRYPKTFGEGLSAIGEAIGERGLMNRLDAMEQNKSAQDAVTEDQWNRMTTPLSASPTARPMSYAPTDDLPPTNTVTPLPGMAPIPGTAGTPTPVEDGGYNALDQGANLRDQRSLYNQQLESNPAAKMKLAALMSAEEGRGGPNSGARTALAETIFNRGVSRGYGDVNKVMDPRYYQPMHDGSGNYAKHLALVQNNPAYREQLFSEIGNVVGGSNVSNLATDNASGTVAANSRRNTSEGWTAPNGEYFARKDVRPDVHGPGPVSQTADWYARTALPPAPVGPQSSVVDPATLNQSVALNQTEPPAPSGPPTAFSGQPVSDAPPVGMPDARDAITSALAPRPPQAVAPPAPPAPAGPQIAQAPPQQQIRVPEREPVPPPAPQATEKMRFIEKTMATIGDPLQREKWAKRYQQEALEQKAIYDQKFEEYKHKRNRWETAPERAVETQKKQQDLIEAQIKSEELKRTGGLGSKLLLEPVAESQKKSVSIPSAVQALRSARATLEAGTFTGTGAEQKLAIAKTKSAVASLFGFSHDDPRIANTETYRANIMPLVAAARAATAGNANISDADIRLALEAAGGSITLDAKSYPKILDALERINVGQAIEHQGKVLGAAAGNETAAQALQGVYGLPMEEIVPKHVIQYLKEHPDLASEFDQTFKTPGLARKILGK